MLNDNITEKVKQITIDIEQAIDQLPNRWFSYLYPDTPLNAIPVELTFRHEGNKWYGEAKGTDRPGEYSAQTFQGVYGIRGTEQGIGVANWTLQSQKEFLSAVLRQLPREEK